MTNGPTTSQPRVVILGGGFGGLRAAQGLKGVDVAVTLIDRRNFHLFQPLLYQVATGGLSPADIAAPLRSILKNQQNVRTLQAEARDIDPAKKEVLLGEGRLPYDFLVVATGATHHYFGKDHWASLAPGLKTIEDATSIRHRILASFEKAELEMDPEKRKALMTFVIVGGGPTGVEMAGAIGELAAQTLRGGFRAIDPRSSRILLVEAIDRILPTYSERLSKDAVRSLNRLGVEVLTETFVADILDSTVRLKRGDREELLPIGNVIWAAGVRASSMGRILSERLGGELDRTGRVVVRSDCSVPGHPEVFVIGDLAHFEQDGRPLPGVAPVAMQQGQHVAQTIRARLEGRAMKPLRYVDKGNLAVIGRAAAVAEFGRFKFTGHAAWLLWIFVHLAYLIGYENRLLVLIQWAWNYFTKNRSALLITGKTN